MKKKDKEFNSIPQWLIKGLAAGSRIPCFMKHGSFIGHISLDREKEKLIYTPLLEDLK